jgi:hypothetical protein
MNMEDLKKLSPEEAIEQHSWSSIAWLFQPTNALQLLLRMNRQMVISELKKKGMPEDGHIRDELIKSLGREDHYRCLLKEKKLKERRMAKKITVTMKDPDGVYESVKDAGYNIDEMPEDVEKVMGKYFEYGEYMTVEIDIEKGTATVLEV